MATRARPLTPIHWTGAAFAALAALCVLGPLGAVMLRADWPPALGPADWAAVRFTLLQAVLSAAVSVTLAIPVARALARRDFSGRRALVTLMGAPFLLPVIVAVLGLLAVFGRAGWINAGLQGIGLGRVDVYGLQGVVLAHVFLNLPLAVRLLLQGWQAIPSERVRLATALGFSGADMRRHFERPLLRAILPGAALLIFLICTTSFAVALILGGGPSATTVELAIYQAFRFDFDLGRAALLGLVQVAICLGAGALAFGAIRGQQVGVGLDRPPIGWPGDGLAARLGDAAVIGVAACFLLLPLLAVVLQGLPALTSLPSGVWQAALRSIARALASTALAVALALPIALLVARLRRPGLVEGLAFLTIAVSPLVVGTGLFLLIRPLANPVALALPITALVNALVALPFLLRAGSCRDRGRSDARPSGRSAGAARRRPIAPCHSAPAQAPTGFWRGACCGFLDGRSGGDHTVLDARARHLAAGNVSPDGRLPDR